MVTVTEQSASQNEAGEGFPFTARVRRGQVERGRVCRGEAAPAGHARGCPQGSAESPEEPRSGHPAHSSLPRLGGIGVQEPVGKREASCSN